MNECGSFNSRCCIRVITIHTTHTGQITQTGTRKYLPPPRSSNHHLWGLQEGKRGSLLRSLSICNTIVAAVLLGRHGFHLQCKEGTSIHIHVQFRKHAMHDWAIKRPECDPCQNWILEEISLYCVRLIRYNRRTCILMCIERMFLYLFLRFILFLLFFVPSIAFPLFLCCCCSYFSYVQVTILFPCSVPNIPTVPSVPDVPRNSIGTLGT